MPDGFQVDVRNLDELAHKLRRAATEGQREADRALLLVGERHKKAAVATLNGHSTSIPGTINVKPLPGAHAVQLTAAGTGLAWAYERGNKDNRAGETFLHPVFAKKGDARYEDRASWQPQKRYPFFRRARLVLRRWTTKTLTEAWKRGMRNAGLKVD